MGLNTPIHKAELLMIVSQAETKNTFIMRTFILRFNLILWLLT
jgi:hypothetical protein